MDNNNLVVMKNIYKKFGRFMALKNVDFTVPKQNIVGLLGDNGAGKSTLVKILVGLLHPLQGDIYFEGQKVDFKSPKDARDHGIEIVYQDLALIKIMNIFRNFFLGREVVSKKSYFPFLDINKMKIVAKEALDNIGIKIRSSDEPVSMLSGGEQQAIAIGRIYYFGAKLLILDEPTAALSIKESNRVLDLVLEAKDRGLSIIFITHNIHHVYPVADKLTILSRGEKLGDLEKKNVTPEYIISAITHGKLD